MEWISKVVSLIFFQNSNVGIVLFCSEFKYQRYERYISLKNEILCIYLVTDSNAYITFYDRLQVHYLRNQLLSVQCKSE